MSTYSPMVEGEVEDNDYLPLTSVLAYTHGSDQNGTTQKGDDSEL